MTHKDVTPRVKFNALISERRLNTRDISKAVGITLRSLHNVLSDNSKSRSARQNISNLLGVQIWADVPITEHRILHQAGTIFRVSSREGAKDFARKCGGLAEIVGHEVELKKDIVFTITPNLTSEAAAREGTKTNGEKPVVFDVWESQIPSLKIPLPGKDGKKIRLTEHLAAFPNQNHQPL